MNTEVKAIQLLHPLLNVPAVAKCVGYYVGKNGRNIGMELQFPDGHRCKLTYGEIAKLQKSAETEEMEQQAAVDLTALELFRGGANGHA